MYIKMKNNFLTRLLFTLMVMDGALGAVLVADFTMSRMVELIHRRPFCRIHVDRGDIQRMLLSSEPRRMRQMSRDAVRALEEACLAVQAVQVPEEDLGGPGGAQGGLQFIYPGTKWCGPGNIADDWGDLGTHAAEDRCCREHDHCPNTLAPQECRRGLCNTGPFTRAHCDCDALFRRCLQTLNTETANTLGAIFFNVVQVTCFKERRPCSQWQRTGYNQSESDELCSQWKYRPSDKYVPLMPLPSAH